MNLTIVPPPPTREELLDAIRRACARLPDRDLPDIAEFIINGCPKG